MLRFECGNSAQVKLFLMHFFVVQKVKWNQHRKEMRIPERDLRSHGTATLSLYLNAAYMPLWPGGPGKLKTVKTRDAWTLWANE